MNAPLFALVTKPKPSPHQFGPPICVPADPELGRDQQTERSCLRCPVIKITFHPSEGGGGRLWRASKDAVMQVADDPGCVTDEELWGEAGK